MRSSQSTYVTGAIVGLALTLPSNSLAVPAVAVTDLVIQSGPGPEFAAIGTVEKDAPIELGSCVADGSWCRISDIGAGGWVDATKLAVEWSGITVRAAEVWEQLGLPTQVFGASECFSAEGHPESVTVEKPSEPDIVTTDLPAHVRAYVTKHSPTTIIVEGEVAVGNTLPGSVRLHPIPAYRHYYANVNQKTVVVEPRSRRVVHVLSTL